jgi:D-ribose pyranase
MAREFQEMNDAATVARFTSFLPPIGWEPHIDFKKRVPHAIGLIRTADTIQYANVILESA